MTRDQFEAAYGRFFGQTQTRPINVDAMNAEELAALIEHPGVHREVKNYAELYQEARSRRLSGNIQAAERIEYKMNCVLNAFIPQHLRW